MSQRNEGMGDGSGRFCEWLLHRAARAAPAALSQRLEEEWLADLAARPSRWSRLRFAVGCCWATRVIAHQHYAPTLAPSGAVPGTRLSPGPDGRGPGYLSGRTTTFLLVVGLHVVFFYVLIAKLSRPEIDPGLPSRDQPQTKNSP